jgi:acyl carrier protein
VGADAKEETERTMNQELEIVSCALALHLEVDPGEIVPSMRLEQDLGLDPLDLVLVVLRLEELGDIEFPVADLEDLLTVGDLVELVRDWSREAMPRVSRLPTLPPPPAPGESGFHRVVPAFAKAARHAG